MPKILIISQSEICYNARLLKAADFFSKKEWEVDVFNPLTGLATKEVYNEVINKRNWKVIENDISKRTISSKFKWLISSLMHRLIVILYNKFNVRFFNAYYLSKGLLLSPKIESNYDVILIHLVNSLPFAVNLKKKFNAKLIYDSQEYFVGQYTAFESNEYRWVKENEKKYIQEVDILLATTHVMKVQIVKDYNLKIPSFRVRNVPSINQTIAIDYAKEPKGALKLVWHGMGIYFNNRRGVHILVEAVAKCKENVKLYLQGNLTADQEELLNHYKVQLNLKDKIEVVPPANPDEIVASLQNYDVGLTAELPEEMNQELTSSNKLFDYIHAGLAVISSNALGLAETIDEYKVGMLYEAANITELSAKIDLLAQDKNLLMAFKSNSINAAKQLNWEQEYTAVFEELIK